MEFIIAFILVVLWFFYYNKRIYNHEYEMSYQRRLFRKCCEKGVSSQSAHEKFYNRQLLIKHHDQLVATDPAFKNLLPIDRFSEIIKMMDEGQLISIRRMESENPFKN